MSIFKTLFGVAAIIELFIIYACLVAGITDRIYQLADIIFPSFGIHYNLQSFISAIYGALSVLIFSKYLKKKKIENIPEIILEYQRKISVFKLILYNIIFLGLIYLGNIIIGKFDNFNINMKQKYDR